jgi:hypothetical protein
LRKGIRAKIFRHFRGINNVGVITMSLTRMYMAGALIAMMALASGCASITRGSSEAYAVETKPPGAEVNSSSGWHCMTPCSVKVKRRSDFVLTITKNGYETVTASVTSSIDGAGAAGMAGNVLLGGIIGAGIDAGTGAMHSHKPNPLVVEMVPLGGIAQAQVMAYGQPAIYETQPAAYDTSHLRAASEVAKSDCEFVKSVTKGAGGSGDPATHMDTAMNRALSEVASVGADSYFIVDTSTTATGASVTLEALNCK